MPTTATHTPGPLTVKPTLSTKFDEAGDCAIVDAEGRIIGEAFHAVDHGTFRPAVANAALWASAPDLLTALRQTLALARLKYGNRDPENLILVAAEAAIAKAEGKV